MSPLSLVALMLAAATQVEVTSLSGERHTGTLIKLTANELSLQPESGTPQTILTTDLLEIRQKAESLPSTAEAPTVRVSLVDGSQLRIEALQTTAKALVGRHALLGDLKLPLRAVRGVRFAPQSAKFDPLWTQLAEKGTKSDMVVLQKQDVLDHLDGVIGAIDDESIRFLLEGDEIAVKREKAFGIFYARKSASAKLTAQVELANGDSIAVKAVAADGETWRIEGLTGANWQLPWPAVTRVDFSLGKVVYLSTLEPRSVKYTDSPQFPGEQDFPFKFRRDRSLEGKPLRLDQKTYPRGLAVHSKTELKYRLGGEYRRLQAQLGIDDEITKYGIAAIRILGDRRELFSAECRPRQPAISLDLDVADVVELDIIVDFGSDKTGIGDRIHLADARLVK